MNRPESLYLPVTWRWAVLLHMHLRRQTRSWPRDVVEGCNCSCVAHASSVDVSHAFHQIVQLQPAMRESNSRCAHVIHPPAGRTQPLVACTHIEATQNLHGHLSKIQHLGFSVSGRWYKGILPDVKDREGIHVIVTRVHSSISCDQRYHCSPSTYPAWQVLKALKAWKAEVGGQGGG
jgi:hypothetical protein